MSKYIIAQTVTTTYYIPEAVDEKDAYDILENDDDGKLIERITIEYNARTVNTSLRLGVQKNSQKKGSRWSKNKGWHSD